MACGRRYGLGGIFGNGSQILFFLIVLLCICGCGNGDGDGVLGGLLGCCDHFLLVLVFLFFFACGGCGFGLDGGIF